MARYFPFILVVGLCLALAPARAQDATEGATPTVSGTADAATPRIDARADARVKAMSDFLAKQPKLRFSVEITYDAVEPDGQKVQLGRRSRVEVKRPSGLYVDSQGDRGWSQLSVFDGKHFLLHDRLHNLYSRVETPATLEAFFDFLFEKYGAAPPLTDFLLADSHAALTDGAETGALLGDAWVAEKACEHIAFTGPVLDWQLWIEKGDSPWPRKLVITYKDVDVRPQFVAVFREWSADPSLSAARFSTDAPSGATETPLEAPADKQSDAEDDSAGREDAGDR